jgi:hypothetical protein
MALHGRSGMTNTVSASQVKALLELEPVLPHLNPFVRYERTQDDCDGDTADTVLVTLDPFGDVYASTTKPGFKRFRAPGGGGNSQRVRRALLILAEAIRLDNEEGKA